ncbi:Iron uptake protein A2 precursor [Pirellula sp. SH-Sr6A]|nr:Iron uptake protein A2 precursor [Pirellula sp. SH-Sr6A]
MVGVGFALVFAMLVGGCIRRAENQVTIYAAADREFASPILDGFERQNAGVEVLRQFDVEASKTLGLVSRIEGEASQPKCDCFWNNEILHTLRLQKQGLLQARKWKIPDAWPKSFRAADGSWVGIAARGRVLLVNKTKLPDREAWPSSVLELADPKWKSRCGIAYPMYGTTATHMAVLASHASKILPPVGVVGPEKSTSGVWSWEQWIAGVRDNAVVLAGNKQVAIAVGQGDLDWCLTDTDDAIGEVESGKPVEIVFPDQGAGGIGTLFIPNTIAVINRAPHPVAAGLLADHLVSETVEGRLVMGNGAHFPLWPDAKEQSRASPNAPVRWAEVDFQLAADGWESLSVELPKIFSSAP